MKWQDGRRSSNVEDDRASSMRTSSGSLGMLIPIIRFLLGSKIGRIVLVIGAVAYFMAYNPLVLLDGGASTQREPTDSPQEQEKLAFVSAVLAQTEDVWGEIFKVRVRATRSPACGFSAIRSQAAAALRAHRLGLFIARGTAKFIWILAFSTSLRTNTKRAATSHRPTSSRTK